MPGIVGYTKKFIILKKDFCTISGINPKGHGKLEIRGLKGSLNISLEGSEPNEIYDVMLVSNNGRYYLGKVYSDKSGKSREDINFNLMDLESKGLSLDKLNGLALIRENHILLSGYMDKEDGSIENYKSEIETKRESTQKLEEENLLEVNPIEEDLTPEVKHPSDEPTIKKSENMEKITGDGLAEGRIDFDKLKDDEPLTNEYLIEKEGFEKEIIQQYEEVFQGKEESNTEFIVEEYKPEFEPIGDLSLKEEYIAIDEDQIAYDFMVKGIEPEPEPECISSDTEEPEFIHLDEEKKVESIKFDEQKDQDEYIVNDLPRDMIPSKEEVKQYVESNQEIVKINNMDYEHNRRVIQKNQTTDYVLNILRYFSIVDPFRQNLDGYRWWRNDFQDEAKGFLPYFSYVTGGDAKIRRTSSTTAREMMSLYNHYLFGLYGQGEEVKYYVYGVPGGFYKDEHPHGGTTGFNTWFSGNETIGYWLLYIDPLTGKVIFPINPMNPVD